MNIKKVDDKPMVIHTKKKMEFHTKERKRSNPCTLTFKRPLTTVFLFSDVFWQLW